MAYRQDQTICYKCGGDVKTPGFVYWLRLFIPSVKDFLFVWPLATLLFCCFVMLRHYVWTKEHPPTRSCYINRDCLLELPTDRTITCGHTVENLIKYADMLHCSIN